MSRLWPAFRAAAVTLVVAAAFGVTAAPARAQAGIYVINYNGALYKLDLLANSSAQIGTGPGVGMQAIGLAFRGGTLYTWDDQAVALREMNTSTGEAGPPISISGLPQMTGPGSITFRPSDGMGFWVDGSAFSTTLFQFDLTTKTSVFLGSLPSSTWQGLTFTSGGAFLGAAHEVFGPGLYQISMSPLGAAAFGPNWGTFNPQVLGGITAQTGNNVFAVQSSIGGASELYQVNAMTGTPTAIVGPLTPPSLVLSASGIAFGNPGAANFGSGGGGGGGNAISGNHPAGVVAAVAAGEGSYYSHMAIANPFIPATSPTSGTMSPPATGSGANASPTLAGPFLPSPSNPNSQFAVSPSPSNPLAPGTKLQVFNVSYQKNTPEAQQASGPNGLSLLAGVVLTALLSLGALGGIMKTVSWTGFAG